MPLALNDVIMSLNLNWILYFFVKFKLDCCEDAMQQFLLFFFLFTLNKHICWGVALGI